MGYLENEILKRAKIKEFGMFIKTGGEVGQRLKEFNGDTDDWEKRIYDEIEKEIYNIICNKNDREIIMDLLNSYASDIAISEFLKGMKVGATVILQLISNPTSME